MSGIGIGMSPTLFRYRPSSGIENPGITFWWRCEGTSLDIGDGKDYSDGDTEISGTGLQISPTAAKVGSNGLSLPSGNNNALIDSIDLINTDSWRIGFWWHPNASADWLVVMDMWSDGSDFFEIELLADQTFYFAYSNESTYSEIYSNTLFDANTWYFIEVSFSVADGEMKLFVDGILDNTLSDPNITSFPATTVEFGSDYVGTVDQFIDNIIISNNSELDLYQFRDYTGFLTA